MRAKKEYKINSTLSMRLTEKAGVTKDLLEFLNDQDKVSQEVFKAIKYWIRTQGANDRIRKTIEQEAMKMESELARYGENRGPYKKHKDDEVEKLKETIRRLENERDKEQSTKDPEVVRVDSQREHDKDMSTQSEVSETITHELVSPSVESDVSDYEAELYGAPVREESSNPMAKALKSIPKIGN